MESAMAGILAIAFILLLSRRLGWNADPARIPLLLATVLFACGLFLPTIGAVEQETAWIIAAQVGTALGGILLVVGILLFERKARPDETPRKRPKTRSERTGTAAPSHRHPPDPSDPFAGPHGDQA